MIILNRGKITYYLKKESVVAHYNSQYTAYTVYALQNRQPFKDFKKTLKYSKPHEYNDIIDLISLALKHKLVGVASRKPTDKVEEIR